MAGTTAAVEADAVGADAGGRGNVAAPEWAGVGALGGTACGTDPEADAPGPATDPFEVSGASSLEFAPVGAAAS